MSNSNVAANYDALPYLGSVHDYLDPAHLAAIARLRGIDIRKPDNLRILEIGCGDGAQVLEYARRYKDCAITAIDISPQHIARARDTSKRQNLKIEFICDDFENVKCAPASFDLIIAHGIYSYLDDSQAHKLLLWCKDALAEQGVCCISLNTLPGWHMRALFGEIAKCGDSSAQTPRERINRARELINIAQESVQEDPRPEGELLRTGLAQINSASDHYIFHEFIGAHAQPKLIHEFAKRADSAGLHLFADARYALTYCDDLCSQQLNLPTEISGQFSGLSEINKMQLGDFVANTSFRSALLCRTNQKINHTLDSQRLHDMQVRSNLKAVSAQTDYAQKIFEEFTTESGRTLASDDSRLRAALHHLEKQNGEWLSINDLISEIKIKIGQSALTVDQLGLERLFAINLIDFRLL